jgi:hypothetical protein
MPKSLLIEVVGILRQSYQVIPMPIPIGLTASSGSVYLGSRLESCNLPEGTQNLIIREGSVSRIHAVVSLMSDEWVIEDLGSDNGLLVLENEATPHKHQRILALQKFVVSKTTTFVLGDVLLRLSL